MINGLILAAGRGSRLKRFTKYRPKSFNKYNDKTFLDLIIDNFKINKIKKIHIITGYKNNLFKNYKYRKFFNKEWNRSSIFFSLYQANELLKKSNCIISYSDIIYNKKAIDILKSAKGDIVVLNNLNWKSVWKLRFKNPLNDLETFKIEKFKKKNYLIEIGKKPKNLSQIKGQFCGLFKITPKGWKKILKLISLLEIDYKNLDITSLLSLIIKKHKRLVTVEDYKDEWFEIDTLKDLKLLKKLYL